MRPLRALSRGLAFDGIRVGRIPRRVHQSEKAGEMSAGRRSVCADASRIDAVIARVRSNEAHYALRILDLRWKAQARRCAMVDREHDIACIREVLRVCNHAGARGDRRCVVAHRRIPCAARMATIAAPFGFAGRYTSMSSARPEYIPKTTFLSTAAGRSFHPRRSKGRQDRAKHNDTHIGPCLLAFDELVLNPERRLSAMR